MSARIAENRKPFDNALQKASKKLDSSAWFPRCRDRSMVYCGMSRLLGAET